MPEKRVAVHLAYPSSDPNTGEATKFNMDHYLSVHIPLIEKVSTVKPRPSGIQYRFCLALMLKTHRFTELGQIQPPFLEHHTVPFTRPCDWQTASVHRADYCIMGKAGGLQRCHEGRVCKGSKCGCG